MRLADFDAMVRRLAQELPPEFLDGVAGIEVSPKTLPHPVREEIYTLGECIPLPLDEQGSPDRIQSQIVLYYGSFSALAEQGDFDWRQEAWDTLTHELRHHLEWRARTPELEDFDWAAEQNFARQDGEPFDPAFYRSGQKIADRVYRIDDDYFLEADATSGFVGFRWHGHRYRAALTPEALPPAFLTVADLNDPPPGDLVLVLRRRFRLAELFRSRPVFQATVRATTFDADPSAQE